MRVVFDTSVLVAAARSVHGASYQLIDQIPSDRFQHCLSTALYLEYQSVLTRSEHLARGRLVEDVIEALRELASTAHRQKIYFRWRPMLCDPNDEMVLELAVAAQCRYLVTHNPRHFAGAASLGVEVILPSKFLHLIS